MAPRVVVRSESPDAPLEGDASWIVVMTPERATSHRCATEMRPILSRPRSEDGLAGRVTAP